MSFSTRGLFLTFSCASIMASALAPRAANADGGAIQQMQVPGPEAQALEQRIGKWDVVMTLRVTPDAEPVVTRGLIADREMVGFHLQEIMRPAAGSKVPDFKRIAYLLYNPVEGRWQYVSLDTRMPVGIMPATSFDRQNPNHIQLQFEPIAFVGMGDAVEGRMIRSNFVIDHESADREVAKQYWVAADGTSREWVAVQYEYSRHR